MFFNLMFNKGAAYKVASVRDRTIVHADYLIFWPEAAKNVIGDLLVLVIQPLFRAHSVGFLEVSIHMTLIGKITQTRNLR